MPTASMQASGPRPPITSIIARTGTVAHDIAVEDIGLALLTFANGALGTIQGSTAVYPGLPERLEITGSEGTAIIEEGSAAPVASAGAVSPFSFAP